MQGAKVKTRVEPKDETKERLGRSPDLYDAFVVCVEGARQRGFRIERIGSGIKSKRKPDWLDQRIKEHQESLDSRRLAAV